MRELLEAAPGSLQWAQLDQRTIGRLGLKRKLEVHYIARSGLARLVAEWRLWRESLRDDVRDLVNPVETFDAGSAVSISRAVRRFPGRPEAPLPVMTASEFLEKILHP